MMITDSEITTSGTEITTSGTSTTSGGTTSSSTGGGSGTSTPTTNMRGDAKIIVNWTTQKFRQNTDPNGNHQENGLGRSFEKYSAFEIVFTIDQLNAKLNKINEILRIPELNPKIEYGAGVRRELVWYGGDVYRSLLPQIKQKLADALWDIPDNKPTDPSTYFAFKYDGDENVHNDIAFQQLDATLTGYKILINSIINREVGLARDYGDITTSKITNLTEISDSITTRVPITINVTKLSVPLVSALQSASKNLIIAKTVAFFDDSREYKTLLNFGQDVQFPVQSWRKSPSSPTKLQLKLFSPASNVSVYDTAFISREIAKTVVDSVTFEFTPPVDNTKYLRPRNVNTHKYDINKKSVRNVTINSLNLSDGFVGSIDPTTLQYSNEDPVFRRWYTGDFNSSELNIDFSDYKNFVHFGSARSRLNAFTQKLTNIEQLKTNTKASSGSANNNAATATSLKIENIIRNFDPYEQFLFYTTSSVAYSSSVDYVTGEVEYNSSSAWPKQIDGTVYSPSVVTGSNWYILQSAIADRYDEYNPNYLVRNLPEHIQGDSESSEFTTFISMVGHVVDNIKVYIDQFPNIYSTNPDPYKELSMDQVYEVATSFGLKLPNVYALEKLNEYITGDGSTTGSRALVAETWKRFLHSGMFLSKTKGTKTSFDTLLNTYGISSPVLQIKETTYPSEGNYVISEELTYGVKMVSSSVSYITVPFTSASSHVSTFELRFKPTLRQSSSILTSDNYWAININPHPSASLRHDYGRVEVVSGSLKILVASSSYFPLYSDDYTHMMLSSQSSTINIIQTDGNQILYQYSASSGINNSLWNGTTYAYVGGSGSMKTTENFDGIVDEVRVWLEPISTDTFINHAYDPGTYAGSTYSSSYTNLYVALSFNQNLSSITSSATNETPYTNITSIPTVPTYGLLTSSYSRIMRNIRQNTPVVGSSIYTNNKIKIAPPARFNKTSIDENGTSVLSRYSSIMSIDDKKYINSGKNIISFGISPTDFINQNIMRTMGIVNVNDLIGDPSSVASQTYTQLDAVRNDYIKYYQESINPNRFIDFFKNLIQAPSEFAEEMTPARSKLLNGIIIQSSILERNKTYLSKKIQVDGTGTNILKNFPSSSTYEQMGAFYAETSHSIVTTDTITSYVDPWSIIDGVINLSSSVMIRSSTPPNKVPPARRVKQYLNTSYPFISSSFVTSSLFDEYSGVLSLEANLNCNLNYTVYDESTGNSLTSDTGYARNNFLTYGAIISEEANTVLPYYDIPPNSDFNDVGTTNYFHKSNGHYFLKYLSTNKREYVVKLDTNSSSPISSLYAPITLLNSGSAISSPGRYSTTFKTELTGALKLANIFSLYKLEGGKGLRLRLYRTSADRDADTTRDFYTVPDVNRGVLFDGIIENDVSPIFPYVLAHTDDSTIYYTIDLISGTLGSNITLYYFAYEPINLAPVGYLPRHYKFTRDNSTALKRRTYIGCTQTIYTTTDGLPPFESYLSDTNKITVNAGKTTGGNIGFGGAGTLDVQK